MKKVISLVVMVMLVVALSATSVFASDSVLSDYFNSVSNSSTIVTVDDSSFSISVQKRSSSGNASCPVNQYVSSISGRISFSSVTSNNATPTDILVSFGSYVSDISVTNTVGCSFSNNSVYFDGSSVGSFDFSVTYSQPVAGFSLRSGVLNSQIVTTSFVFESLSIDDSVIVSDVIGERFNFSIPSGYALLIQGDCDILERDYSVYNSWNFYQNDARRVNGSRERVLSTGNIVDGFSFDHNLTFAQAIQWIPRNANLFGSSTNYEYSDFTSLSLSSGSTFLISNPQYIGTMENVGNVQTKENNVPLTGTIYMEYSTRPTIKYIALESQIDFNQVGVYYNVFKPDVYEAEASTTTDGTDVIVTPDYTGTTVPPDGGNNGQPPYNPDETVEGLLSNFINSIRSLISTATQAISDLVNTGSGFMQSIATMFTWLPSPLLSVIIGGLTILIVVGVLKVLWR